MLDEKIAAPVPPEPRILHHMDWGRAVANLQNEEKLWAFLGEYLAELGQFVEDLRKALSGNDNERIREAAQQIMGRSSYVAAVQLHKFASNLVEAIDLDEEGIAELVRRTVEEAEELEKEINKLLGKDAPTEACLRATNPSGMVQCKCCVLS